MNPSSSRPGVSAARPGTLAQIRPAIAQPRRRTRRDDARPHVSSSQVTASTFDWLSLPAYSATSSVPGLGTSANDDSACRALSSTWCGSTSARMRDLSSGVIATSTSNCRQRNASVADGQREAARLAGGLMAGIGVLVQDVLHVADR
jgi:hypothetical protein